MPMMLNTSSHQTDSYANFLHPAQINWLLLTLKTPLFHLIRNWLPENRNLRSNLRYFCRMVCADSGSSSSSSNDIYWFRISCNNTCESSLSCNFEPQKSNPTTHAFHAEAKSDVNYLNLFLRLSSTLSGRIYSRSDLWLCSYDPDRRLLGA